MLAFGFHYALLISVNHERGFLNHRKYQMTVKICLKSHILLHKQVGEIGRFVRLFSLEKYVKMRIKQIRLCIL